MSASRIQALDGNVVLSGSREKITYRVGTYTIKTGTDYNIQILTGTVMTYHVSVDCQESYTIPKGLYFPEACSADGIYSHKGKYNSLGTTDT